MTPLPLQLLLPAVVVISAGLVLWKFSWREYPALVAWMIWCAIFESYTRGSDLPFPKWLMGIHDGVGLVVALEVVRHSRIKISAAMQLRASAAIVAVAWALSGSFNAYLFRSYFMLLVALIPVATTVYRLIVPVLEARRDVIYRCGASMWLLVLAVSLSFVRGGLGYKIFPYTQRTWAVVNLATYIVLPVTIAAMAIAMVATVRGRKRAAKRPDGKTVTGRLELVKAA